MSGVRWDVLKKLAQNKISGRSPNSQVQLAKKAGVAPSVVSKMVNGATPSLSSRRKLSKALNMPIKVLFPEVGKCVGRSIGRGSETASLEKIT